MFSVVFSVVLSVVFSVLLSVVFSVRCSVLCSVFGVQRSFFTHKKHLLSLESRCLSSILVLFEFKSPTFYWDAINECQRIDTHTFNALVDVRNLLSRRA